MNITKIVLTGGPCAGKSTAMTWIQEAFTKLGYTVLFVSETATELITGGITPKSCPSPEQFQNFLFALQMKKEAIFMDAAHSMNAEKILIVCDRGLLDNKAYMSDEAFQAVLNELKSGEVEIRDHYDAVFHLVSAAKGAEKFYTTQNNTARTETLADAAALDDKIIAAWTGHPHLRIIDNSTDFENKMKRLIQEISLFLGEPEPFEIERKFLIEYPDIQWLESQPNCQRIEIIQTYLHTVNPDEEIRLRQRGINGHYLYFKTTKRKISETKRVELERRLTKDEYITLMMEADTSKHQIRKDRYCLTYENQYFEIDVYKFWDHQAILEIELNDENAPVKFPEQLHIIKEVTDDPAYKNASLASMIAM